MVAGKRFRAVPFRNSTQQHTILMAFGIVTGHEPVVDAREGMIKDRLVLSWFAGRTAVPAAIDKVEFGFQQSDQIRFILRHTHPPVTDRCKYIGSPPSQTGAAPDRFSSFAASSIAPKRRSRSLSSRACR
jgi:hypothetical protein